MVCAGAADPVVQLPKLREAGATESVGASYSKPFYGQSFGPSGEAAAKRRVGRTIDKQIKEEVAGSGQPRRGSNG